jgi:beta-lactam-binding protein with PASTA domain/tRNA A-37 threonylcarbamoyl transferase component Bud32
VATTLNDQIGRVLGGRYRLIAPIGSGASAQVYLADDTTLRRRVAVKILHQGLATDETFLRRFRAEAQAAAAMNHPHILAVYDWGEDDVPYLVSEYLAGGSLRSMLDAGHQLSVSQALLVGLEAARGLEYAHRQKIVHRDIKPANLVFDDEARLRIADFGIARALAEAGWTEQGTVVGTARYASPEQAKSDPLTGKSDVYALGLVLIESVTGDVPFRGDTPLGTLVARIDQHVPVPKEMGALRRVLERAGNPDPDERPDAGEFIIGLMAAAEECARPAPLPLVGAIPKEPGEPDDGGDRTEVNSAPVLAPPAVKSATKSKAPDAPEPTRVFERVERAPAPRDSFPPVEVYDDFEYDDVDDGRHRRRWPWVLLGILLLLGAAGGGVAAYLVNRTVSHTVPDNVVGMTVAELQQLADDNDWVLSTTPDLVYDAEVPKEHVVSTTPGPGEKLDEGAIMDYSVSNGPAPVTVPEIAGLDLEAARAALQAEGLVLGQELPAEPDETVPAGMILRAEFTEQSALPGTEIPYVLSAGPVPRVLTADLFGQPYDAVASRLTEMRLQPLRAPEDQYHDTVPAGSVIGFKTGDGATDLPVDSPVPADSQVQVVVSKGHAPVQVPNLSGRSVQSARDALVALGFTISGVDGDIAKRVIGTNPTAGETVPFGTAVRIYAQP